MTELALTLPPELVDAIATRAGEMVLEGLHSIDKISRSEERGFAASDRRAAGTQELYRDYSLERNRYKKPLN